MDHIKLFEEFILEKLNYNLYRGVYNADNLIDILDNGYIMSSNSWSSTMRKNMKLNKKHISVTRNFSYALKISPVIEFDTDKLTDDYDVVPFLENPDFYIWYLNNHNNNNLTDIIKSDDKYINKEFWKYKTNKKSDDFGIAEEVIKSKKIPIKYIKNIYIKEYDINDKLINKLVKLNIDFKIIDSTSKYLSDIKYKNKIKSY